MTDVPEIPKKGVRTQAEIILQMTKEAQRVERRIGAQSCVVICFFDDGNNQIRVQDAGRFPMPPDQFYDLMIQAHVNGQLGHNSPKKSRIIKPH